MQSIFKYFQDTQKDYFDKLNNYGLFLSKKYYLVFGINVITEDNIIENKDKCKTVLFKDQTDLDYFIKELDIYNSISFKNRILNIKSDFPIEVHINKFRTNEKQGELLSQE